MSGGVGGALSDGCPYPYLQIFYAHARISLNSTTL